MDRLQSLTDLLALYRTMKKEGGEPIADQLMGSLAAEIESIDQYGGAHAPALCRAPMTPKAVQQRLDSLVKLWGEVHTTGIVFTRVLGRTIGELAAAAATAAAPMQPWLRLLFAQLLRVYLVSQVTGNADITSTMSRPDQLLQELELAMELQTAMEMRLQTATKLPAAELQQSLQALFAIGIEFVRICSRVSDLYE